MSNNLRSKAQSLRRVLKAANESRIAELSALLEDPILAGDIEGHAMRRQAMVELCDLRGFDIGSRPGSEVDEFSSN